MTGANWKRADWWRVALLLALVTIAWCAHYYRTSRSSWSVPVAYLGDRSWDMASSSDAIWGMAATKAQAEGEISFFSKRPISFGAPFRANWNEWPTIDEAINCWWALLARSFGLFAGSNLALLSAHLFAALSFYFVCRHLRYDGTMAFAGAVLFALSRYAFWRGLPHLTLTFYWHLPLVLLVLWWCIREESISTDRRKLGLCAAVVVITGLQNAYYSAMFLHLLVWAALFWLLRQGNWRRAMWPLAWAGLLLATIAFANIDTFVSWLAHGPHFEVAPRNYAGMELYALRPVEFFLPRSHSWSDLATRANRFYFNSTFYAAGEEGSVYLGLAGIAALILLASVALSSVVRKTPPKMPVHFWGVFLIICFSVIGGLNGIAGLAGMLFFRCGNRYSIVILTILLLFLVKQLTWLSRHWHRATVSAVAALLIAVGLYDQIPPGHPEQEAMTRTALMQEANLVSQIEARVQPSGSIFQLPVREFPESPPQNAMVDYEHFRPYLHSSRLRFSYGDAKVGHRERWQKEAERLPPRDLIKLLESYGFEAILINRRGYADRAEALITDLRSANGGGLISDSEDFLSLQLNPARHAVFPPIFGDGWYELEGDDARTGRWSAGDATLVLHNGESKERIVRINCGITTLGRRNLKIVHGSRTLYKANIKSADAPSPVDFRVALHPGENELRFLTDKAGIVERIYDSRKLAYQLTDLRILPAESGSSEPTNTPAPSSP